MREKSADMLCGSQQAREFAIGMAYGLDSSGGANPYTCCLGDPKCSPGWILSLDFGIDGKMSITSIWRLS